MVIDASIAFKIIQAAEVTCRVGPLWIAFTQALYPHTTSSFPWTLAKRSKQRAVAPHMLSAEEARAHRGKSKARWGPDLRRAYIRMRSPEHSWAPVHSAMNREIQ